MAGKWKGQTRGGALGYLFFIYLIRWLGVRAAYAFLCLVVTYFIPFAPKATRSVWVYSRRILRQGRLRSVGFLFRNYYRLGQTLIDKVAVQAGMKDRYRFQFENYDEFLRILNADTGVVVIGAHIGNWEIGSPFFDEYGKKINIVMFDNEHRRIKEILESNKEIMPDFKVIGVRNGSLDHVFQITEALDKHEYVCFQGDRYVNEDKLLSASFMGWETQFPQGPFLLASRLRKPVVFYFAMRERHRTYRFHFFVADPVAGRTDGQPLLRQYVTVLEKMVRKYPEQWFNYFDFWNIMKNNKD